MDRLQFELKFLSIHPYEVLLWVGQAGASVEPKCLLFSFLLFLIIFLHTFQEVFSALRVLNSLGRHINSLGRNLALNLFVYNNVNSMLGDIVDSSCFATVTFVGHSFLKSVYSLDIYNITFLVDSPVCSQRNNSKFSRRPRECVVGTPFPLCWSFWQITKRWQF